MIIDNISCARVLELVDIQVPTLSKFTYLAKATLWQLREKKKCPRFPIPDDRCEFQIKEEKVHSHGQEEECLKNALGLPLGASKSSFKQILPVLWLFQATRT